MFIDNTYIKENLALERKCFRYVLLIWHVEHMYFIIEQRNFCVAVFLTWNLIFDIALFCVTYTSHLSTFMVLWFAMFF